MLSLTVALVAALGGERIARQIDAVMSSPRRLEALPRVISDVHVDPSLSPTFVVRRIPDEIDPPGLVVTEGVEGTWRLLQNARVLGGSGGVVLLSLRGSEAASTDGIRLDADGTRHEVVLPDGAYSAFETGRWYVLALGGLHALTEDAPTLVTDVFGRQHLQAVTDGKRLVLSTVQLRPRQLVMASVRGDAAVVTTLDDARLGDNVTVLPDPDGDDHLFLGQRLIRRSELRDVTPIEADLVACLDAARSGDEASVARLLTRLTRAPRDQLRGLADNLRQIADPAGDLVQLERWLAGLRDDADERRRQDDAPLAEAMESLLTSAEHARAETRRLLAAKHALAPRVVADQVGRRQLFDGAWIEPPGRTLYRDASRALVRMHYERPDERAPVGLVIVKADGTLIPLPVPESTFRYGGMTYVRPSYAVPTADGAIMLLVRGVGLARIDAGTLRWVDESWPVRSMDRLIGSDRNDRLHFERSEDGGTTRFAYRADGAVAPTRPLTAVALSGIDPAYAVPDGGGGVWLVGRRDLAATGGPPLDAEIPLMRDVVITVHAREPRRLGIDLNAMRSRNSFGHAVGDDAPTLFRIDGSGTLHRFVSDPNGGNLRLWPSREGAVVGVGRNRAFVVNGTTISIGRDLHDLAETFPDTLTRFAPRHAWSGVGAAHQFNWNEASVTRVGDVVVVAQNGILEAYRHGVALGLTERVAARTGPFDACRIYGPVVGDDGEHVLVSTGRDASNAVWITAPAGGGDLAVTPIPRHEEPTQRERLAAYELSSPRLSHDGRRLIFPGRGRFLSMAGPDRQESRRLGGVLHLVGPDDTFVVQMRRLTVPTYAFVQDEAATTIDSTWMRDHVPLAIAADGRIIASTWDGLVWLRRDEEGTWKIDARLMFAAPSRPTRLLAESPDAVTVVCGSVLVRVAR